MQLFGQAGITPSSFQSSSSNVGGLLYTYTGAANNDYFGSSVAISDSYFAIVAKSANSGNGIIYVYNRSDGSLAYSTNGSGQGFGKDPHSLAMTDSKIIIGQPSASSGKGGYKMIATSDGSYDHAANMPSPSTAGDYFGMQIAVDDTAGAFVLGVAYEDTGGTNSGSAYYYNMSGVLQATVRNPNAGGTTTEQDQFGRSVAMGPTASAVGAPRDFSRVGSVYHRSTTGTAVRTLSSSMGGNQKMGSAVGITGNLIVSFGEGKIQANRIDTGAEVYSVSCNSTANDPTGSSVGANAAIQSRHVDDEAATNAGAVDWYSPNTGDHIIKIVNPNTTSMAINGGQFGTSTAINGSMAIISAPGNTSAKGQVFVYSTV
jgi:hypothetical protein